MMTNILCLDLGTTTGWAIYDLMDGTMQPKSGSVLFKKPKAKETEGQKFLRFRDWLTEIKNKTYGKEICHVFYEKGVLYLTNSGMKPAHVWGAWWGVLLSWCEHHGIPYSEVGPTELKKYTTGKGNASKEDVIKAMQAKGHNPKDENEADALAVMYWALEKGEAAQ